MTKTKSYYIVGFVLNVGDSNLFRISDLVLRI